MQFRVPQFLDIEDKVFGPFTFKQFGFMLGAISFAYLFWKLLPVYFSMPLIIIISGNFLALAFVEVNGRKYGEVLEAAVKYFLKAKIFVWQKKEISSNSLPEYQLEKLKTRLTVQKKIESEKNQAKEIKNQSLVQIRELSRKLDMLENPEPEKQTRNLREKLLKERHGFRV